MVLAGKKLGPFSLLSLLPFSSSSSSSPAIPASSDSESDDPPSAAAAGHLSAGDLAAANKFYALIKKNHRDNHPPPIPSSPMVKALNLMVSKKCSPNASTFNLLFGCISKLGDVNAAHRMFARMDLDCEPNAVTYKALMKMFAGTKSTDMVIKLKKDMDDNRYEPNVNTYKILIAVFCGMGHWNRAYKIFREMIEEKCLKPTLAIYEMVLEQHRMAGQLKKHEELVEKMVSRGFASRPV